MAASSVLSLVLLLMVGMQDQMSRAWTNANRRTEATREARAGLRMLTEDFIHYYIRDVYTNTGSARANYNPTTNPIPMVYFTNAGAGAGGLTIPDAQPGSQALFFLSQRRPPVGMNADQLTAVGYYIASATNTNINGMQTVNYHLYRYVNTNTYLSLSNFLTAPGASLALLFPNIGPTNTSNNEILARNSLNLRISFYPSNLVTNGAVYTIPENDPANRIYSGNRCVFELTTYPETVANSMLQAGNILTTWTSTNNLRRYGRSYEITMDLERNLSR